MSSGRKRTTDRHYSAEDQALDQISKEAEEKIQARRQARAEAREIRLREIERQQKEEEEKQKGLSKAPDLSSLSGYSGSRRGSDDSTGSDISSSSRDPKDQVRVVKNKLRDLEEKYKAAMVTNAQLDNIKTSHVFQLELLKEQIEEQEEAMIEVQREYKEKSRVYDLLKRDFDALKLETEVLRQQIDMKDKLIKESGLVIATTDDGNLSLSRCSDLFDVPVTEMGSAIISEESADLLKKAGEGTLDDKLKKILADKKQLQEEITILTNQISEERAKRHEGGSNKNSMNGPAAELQLYEIQREASKQIHEYKLKLQKAEQEITNLDGTVNRLETQVKRFKYDAEEAERLEEELKSDRRRLQRELRECQNQIEELQNQNKHLTKRLEKIRQTRSALGVNT
ncbi:LRRFIP [Mactra antiquata]